MASIVTVSELRADDRVLTIPARDFDLGEDGKRVSQIHTRGEWTVVTFEDGTAISMLANDTMRVL